MKYALTENTRELKNKADITEGCTLDSEWQYPRIIKIFNDLEEAKQELSTYKSNYKQIGNIYNVVEYYIEEVELDENNEIYNTFDIIDFASFE